ncbi:MAG: hypothetical protein JWN15_449 [Firmicutes bacterium]|nr:hypothetical protein [Bacillota bacterium]
MQRHFAGIAAHDLEEILATLAPQRARLYSDHRTVDRRRLTVNSAKLLSVQAVDDPVPVPAYTAQYAETAVLKVDYDLNLVEPEQRRDPTLREGRQWSYYIVVCAGPGQPWLIVDWGV